MKIFITGGAGSLGSNIVEHYLPQGHEILVLDNFETSKREVFPGAVDGLSIIEGSINDDSIVNKLFADFQPTHVIHSAASYKDPGNWKAVAYLADLLAYLILNIPVSDISDYLDNQ